VQAYRVATARKKKSAAAAGAGGEKKYRCPNLEGDPDARDVVTRFPPEPSGHLHVGHSKAVFLNQYYAKEHKGGGGTLLLRFDDTNPANEKEEYEHAILDDLRALEIVPDRVSHTSDYFAQILDEGLKLIKNGLAFCDLSTQDELALQRGRTTGVRVASPYRDNTVQRNEELWTLMLKGEQAVVNGSEKRSIVLRAKVVDDKGTPGYECGNGSMRDPVLFRVITDTPHARTGTKFKCYPTYDMACPVVDSLEGVTHVLRDSQYADREEQFVWLQRAMGLRRCYIQPFSRVNFKRTVMSKRKLADLVAMGVAEGWDDPRFPTIKGMLRRGLAVASLREFMIGLGGSLRTCDMEWDKIWSDNMRLLDPTAHRFMAVSKPQQVPLTLEDWPHASDADVVINVPLLPKDPSKGAKPVFVTRVSLLERVDVAGLAVGATLGLMRYCVVEITSLDVDAASGAVTAVRAKRAGEDFKSAARLVTWVSNSPHEIQVDAWEYDYILDDKADDDDAAEDDEGAAAAAATSGSDWRKHINRNSAACTVLVANAALRVAQKGQVVQLERRGLYIVDRPCVRDGERMRLIKIPDGKKKDMSVLAGALEHR